MDVYATQINSLGDWALVRLTDATRSARSSVNTSLLAAGIFALVATGLVVGLRFNRNERLP